MPRKAKGARLDQRKNGIWYVRDTGRNDISTGTRDRRGAEAFLANYIAQKGRGSGGPAEPSAITVSEVLAIYGSEHARHVSDPSRIGYAISALDSVLGDLMCSSINSAICRRYASSRKKPGRRDPETKEVLEWVPIGSGTIRRELGTLQAALRYCAKEGYLSQAPVVELPRKPEPKDRWLTRSEVARLLWAAYRSKDGKHLARFILIAVKTGTRKTATLGLQWQPNTMGGWIDLENGMLYRRASAKSETKKRTPSVPLPRTLQAHLQRWARDQERWVISDRGARIASIKTTWRTACKNAGLEGVVPHTLRHTAITWAMQRGADLYHVEGYFGVSRATIESVYAHHHPDHLQSAVAAMDRR